MKKWVVVVLCVVITGCQATTPDSSSSPDTISQLQQLNAEATLEEAANLIRVQVNDITLTIAKPDEWEYYPTDFGVVLTEHIASVATEGVLGGVLTHVWVPPLDEFTVPSAENVNLAWFILNQIIEDPEYIGSAAVSAPAAFEWDGLDAAYYLLDNGDGNLSIVIGIAVPGTTRLVTCSVGAPAQQSDRIRALLPVLLDDLTINGLTLEGSGLEVLPDVLSFPRLDPEASVSNSAA